MSVGEVKSAQKSPKEVYGNGTKKRSSAEKEDYKVRLRRTQSVAKAEQITGEEKKLRNSQPDKPCHKARDSLFSWSSGFDRYEGFITWGALLLMLGGTRLFLENVLKYGIRISPSNLALWLHKENQNDAYYTPLYLLVFNLHYLTAYTLEVLMSRNKLSSNLGMKLQLVNLASIVMIPIVLYQFWASSFSLLGRIVICCVSTVAFIKLWSYVQVNYWCRIQRQKEKKSFRQRSHSFRNLFGDESDDDLKLSPSDVVSFSYCPVEYPDNLTLKDLYYFLAAPTLCYELNFPRSTRIRIKFLLRRLLEVFVLSNILLGLFQQWIIPSVRNSFKPFSEMDYFRCTERLLKLSIPNHLLWLIWFYMFFHSFLNTLGELLMFSDRNFYQDWWNSRDVGTFWRLWNMPVHKWCVRHLFVPLLRKTHSKTSASLAVFLLSAFFHEYIVSIPLGMYKIHVFMGMLVQVPLVHISSYLAKRFGGRVGNIIVWASLILGQPVGIMVYYHDYIIQNYDPANLGI